MKLAFIRGVIKSIWIGLKYSNLPYIVILFTPKYHIPVPFYRKGNCRVNHTLNAFLAWDKEWKKKRSQSISN